jgi:Lipocalin-like domain
MKKTNCHFLFLLIAVSALFFTVSCKKSSSTNSSAITVQNLVGTYGLTSLTVTIAPFPPQNILDSIPACQRDDEYKLNADMSYNYIDAGTKCIPPGDGSGTWSLSGNTLIIDSINATIQKFDGKNLTLSTPVVYNGISATTTETLTKQ